MSIILSRKAISGNRVLNNIEIGMVSKTDHNAALEVVRFQNNPIKKIHKTPGVTNPVYSWINKNNFPIVATTGVTITAKRSAVAVTNLPILTRWVWEADLLICFLKTSRVKIVATLLHMELSEDMMAAINAAITNPE